MKLLLLLAGILFFFSIYGHSTVFEHIDVYVQSNSEQIILSRCVKIQYSELHLQSQTLTPLRNINNISSYSVKNCISCKYNKITKRYLSFARLANLHGLQSMSIKGGTLTLLPLTNYYARLQGAINGSIPPVVNYNI